MSINNIELKTQPISHVEINNTNATVSIDNSIQVNASAGITNNYSNIEAGASIKTGTIASASAGLEGKNVYANISYSDTTEAHLTADTNINYHGLGNSTSVDAYAVSGTQLDASMMVGKKGVDVNAGASTGSYVGVDANTTMNLREASATASAGITIGEHFEIGGGGKATYNHGEITVGVSGDVAAIVGLEIDAQVSIDTKQIQKDVNTVINETNKIIHNDDINHTLNTTTHTIDKGIKETSHVVNKAGKDIKKAFKKLKI